MRIHHQIAKESGDTDRGNFWAIVQDSPNSFHVTIQVGDQVIVETLRDVPSLDFLHNQIRLHEDELLTLIGTNE